MWASHPDDQDSEGPEVDPWRIMYRQPDNRGTNPHLESATYNGYGVTLRAAVDTSEEISVHLQQIDEGPNYRWGVAGEGGCGVIYFYAAGKSYSHNGREDVGERQTHDTDFCSNTGVWKNGAFRSIGRNVLATPLRNLGLAQFAEITPRHEPNSYSWPEYQGRSILLAGSDYFAVYDHVFSDAITRRFSWFTEAREDMPIIRFVKGAGNDAEANLTRVTTSTTKGLWQDGMGDSMAIVTHRRNLRIDSTPYGARVASKDWTDHVIQSVTPTRMKDAGIEFQGKTGLIREFRSETGGRRAAGSPGTRLRVCGIRGERRGRKLAVVPYRYQPGKLAELGPEARRTVPPPGMRFGRTPTSLVVKWSGVTSRSNTCVRSNCRVCREPRSPASH